MFTVSCLFTVLICCVGCLGSLVSVFLNGLLICGLVGVCMECLLCFCGLLWVWYWLIVLIYD